MEGFGKTVSAMFLTLLMILSALAIAPAIAGMDTGFAPAPPASGDWVITGAESYKNTELVVTGDLVIQNGGSLTLRNVTLRMNVTASANPLTITVEAGGTLNIWDSDNDAATTDDRSLITDSAYDTDDLSSLDYRYYFVVEKEGAIHINNSAVEECGVSSASSNERGLYIAGNNTIIHNTTFSKCGYAIILSGANNTLIKSVSATSVTTYISATSSDYLVIDNCFIDLGTVNYGIQITGSDYVTISNTDVKCTYDPIFLNNADYSVISNCSGEKTSTLSSYRALKLQNCDRLVVDGFTGYGHRYVIGVTSCTNSVIGGIYVSKTATYSTVRYYGMLVSSSYNVTVKDSTFIGLYEHGLQITGSSYSTVTNCTFDGTGGGREGALYVQSCSNLIIENNTIGNWSRMTSGAGLYLYSSSNNIVKYNYFYYNRYKEIYLRGAHNNRIIHNSIGIHFNSENGIYISSSSSNNYIGFNRIEESGTGVYLLSGDYNIIENNIIKGGNDEGIRVSSNAGSNNKVINCTVQDYYWGIMDDEGIEFINTNVTSNEIGFTAQGPSILENVSIYDSNRDGLVAWDNVIAKNSSFQLHTGSYYDVEVNSAEVTLINSTYTKQYVAAGAKLWIKWWVDFYVKDVNGPVSGAVIRVYNGTDDEEINATVGDDGNITLPITEKLYYGSWIDFNTHNLTAESLPDVANVTPRQSITTNTNFTITFAGDTHPPPPVSLQAVSQSDDVLLTWDYFQVLDLDHFEIFRSTDQNNFGTTPIGTAPAGSNFYLDNDGASDWTQYYYQVRANDTAGSLSYPSNTAQCGDWVVAYGNSTAITGKGIILNGSIIIEDGASLSFSSTKLWFNCSYNGEYGIRVIGDGVLEIKDGDDNDATEADASNISALDPAFSTAFMVETGASLYMNNSLIYGVGYSGGSITDGGMYVYGNRSIIRGNRFIPTTKTVNALILVEAEGVVVKDNVFEHQNSGAMILSYTLECIIDNNIFKGSDKNNIELDHTVNTTISNNTIRYAAYGIYLDYCNGDLIENNLVEQNDDYGIYVSRSQQVTVYNNSVNDHRGNPSQDKGITIFQSSYCFVTKNTLDNNEYGILISGSDDISVISNVVTNVPYTGIYLFVSDNNYLEDNTVSSCDTGIEFLQAYNDNILIGGNISSCNFGLSVATSLDTEISDVEIYGNGEGIRVVGSSDIRILRSTIAASTNYGVYVDSISTGPYTAWLENCSIYNPGAMDIGGDNYAVAYLINTTVPYSQVEFVDAFSKIALFWYVDINVLDMFGQPAVGANVTIKQASGQTVTLQTDANGYIEWLMLHDKTMLEVGNLSSNPYIFSAVLGNHSGANNTNIDLSKTVIIDLENKAPSALNVQLTPAAPSTLDDLSVAFSYSDPENDPAFPYTIQWFADGVEQPALENQTSITSANTQKGQNWYAKVTVFDGAAHSVDVDSNIITVQNSKPVASGVTISPASPSSTTNISVDYSFSDSDNDGEGNTLVNWLVDRGSGFIDSGLSGTTLYHTQTKKGEKWKARVLPNDGEEYGGSVDSNELTIGNSPPEAQGIKILPEAPVSTQGIYLDFTYFDIDDDAEGASTFKWYRDTGSGFNVVTGQTFANVSASVTNKGEAWKCEYTPHDGTEAGTTIISGPVTIGNSPPSVSNIIIEPENPSKYSNLTVEYIYSDPDDDDEDRNATIIKWFVKKKGVVGFAFYSNDLTIPGSELTKGDEWMCEIKPSDGEGAGNFTQSVSSVFVINAPPIASELTITPSDPRQGMVLTANYKYFDIDADPEDTGERAILWYRNGEQVDDYDNMISLPNNVIRKGETWKFTLRPHDGEEYGSGQTSPSFIISGDVIIGNTAPVVNNTFINPAEPASNDNLSADYSYFDIDGDEMDKVEIHWFRNEVHIESFNNLPMITKEMTFKGDVWYFKIRVFDGLAYSDWITSPPKLIVNTPPAITFYSPDSLSPVVAENEKLTFLVDASDPDKDDLDYFWFVNGKIENLGKAFALETDYDSERWYLIRIEVSDGSEKVEMSWNVSVTDKNRVPTITIQTPEGKKEIKITTLESQEFIVTTEDEDREDDELDIIWYLDEEEVLSGEDRYVFQPSDIAADYEVLVEVTDGKDTVTESWNVSVEKVEKNVTLEEKEEDLLMGQTYDWWGLFMAIISGIAAAFMFLFGLLRVKKKKGKLKEYMDKIEVIKDSNKRASGKEKDLMELKKLVKREFSDGTVSENHYIILEREIDDALGDVRTDMVGKSVSKSSELHSEVEKILADGIVTKREYQKAKKLIENSDELTVAEKRELDEMMENWSREHEETPRKEDVIEDDEEQIEFDNDDPDE